MITIFNIKLQYITENIETCMLY